jgi:hypothetical protein
MIKPVLRKVSMVPKPYKSMGFVCFPANTYSQIPELVQTPGGSTYFTPTSLTHFPNQCPVFEVV